MGSVRIRYYTSHLGFDERCAQARASRCSRAATPAPAQLAGWPGRGLAGDADGTQPEPGGWSRIQLEFDDLEAAVAGLRAAATHFRSDVIEGRGGKQVILDDPSGNPIELFEPSDR